jgi:putative endonuclease
MSGYLYILKCADDSYYTGSTKDLEKRIQQHQKALGANYTKKKLPVELIYYEEYERIDDAFYREKQIQNWSKSKKEALILGENTELPKLAKKIFRKA